VPLPTLSNLCIIFHTSQWAGLLVFSSLPHLWCALQKSDKDTSSGPLIPYSSLHLVTTPFYSSCFAGTSHRTYPRFSLEEVYNSVFRPPHMALNIEGVSKMVKSLFTSWSILACKTIDLLALQVSSLVMY
jgi:hypothetical protein